MAPRSLDVEKLRTFECAVVEWVASGAATTGRVRLCLRVREPDDAGDRWNVELLAQDLDDPSLVVSAAQVWDGSVALGPLAIEEMLAAWAGWRGSRLSSRRCSTSPSPTT